MNRTDRLLAIVLYLQGRRFVRAEDLAGHFAVSLRTIYRDIAALGEAGVPISGEAGVGYQLVKGYHLPPVSFTAGEAAALFLGGELAKHYADASLRTAADSALLKIRSVLPAGHQDEIARLEKATVINGPWHAPAGIKGEVLRPIQQALVARTVLRLVYRARARTDDTVREVEPMGVVFAGGAWYLVAWCRLRGAVRHFRLDRIRRLDPGTERFAPRAGFDLQRHLDEIEASSPRIEVRLRAAPAALERLHAESHCGVRAEPALDGRIDVRLETYSLDWCARWVLSFGADVEAVAPPALRSQIHALARAVLRRHPRPAPAGPRRAPALALS